MKQGLKYLFFIMMLMASCKPSEKTEVSYFEPTQESAMPWVYWYWLKSAYSKEGITADLESMKQAGIRGAYLMTIKGPGEKPLMNPPVLQLSDEFWELVRWALIEADRLGVKIAFHPADGFAVAGGPWITPEMSMQKVVWADTIVQGTNLKEIKLPTPKHYKNFYKDIATFAFPTKNEYQTSIDVQPKITTSINEEASFLSDASTEQIQLRLYEPGYIQYEFKEPFSCKSIHVETKGNNYQAHRMLIEVSDDGKTFKSLGRLETPRSGWQDTDENYTHSLTAKAKYFRLVYDPKGSEPGAEDIDMAKWNQGLKVTKIILSEEPLIENFEGKSGAVWRISSKGNAKQIPKEDCVDPSKMINISEFVNDNGVLNWQAPSEQIWKIMRFGHTSTGHENATAGGGRGLEVDKFNADAVRFQLDHWFGKMLRVAGPELSEKVVEILHMDSWECGSQNWSPVFRKEFKNRRGYDVVEYLPVMAGIPLSDMETSENVLYDIRKTISELIIDNFFAVLAEEAKKAGVKFSSENVAPTMTSDGLLHFKHIDYPSGEFWLRSPTHDKPNDILDAISGGHIYGKDIIQAEAFTQLRMDWNEHPGNLKTLADRNYALGVNRFFYHVFVHNPWLDRKPGMTLDPIGTFFQRDQTWWKPGKAFFEYCKNVQFQLQKGNPVIDFAVFTGEEIPSRSVLPDRLVSSIPNIFGAERVASEKKRIENLGQPSARMPKEVKYSKNSTDLSEWINALNGYKYDSFNKDVLLSAYVRDGSVIFSDKVAYQFLMFPGTTKMSPNKIMSLQVAEKILDLVKDGATVFVNEKPTSIPGKHTAQETKKWQQIIEEIWINNGTKQWSLGKGKVVKLPYLDSDFSAFGVTADVTINKKDASTIAWTHRAYKNEDIYFLANQKEEKRQVEVSFRVINKTPVLYNPVTDETRKIKDWKVENGRTLVSLEFDKNESLFVIFKEDNHQNLKVSDNWSTFKTIKTLNENWTIQFDKAYHGPSKPIQINKLFDWTTSTNDSIKYYSGTAIYTKTFDWNQNIDEDLYLQFDEINNIAEISINGKHFGVLWTYPYQKNISKTLQKGENTLTVKVTNTWANRLIGDEKLPKEQRLTWTTAPYRLDETMMVKSGLLGEIKIQKPLKK